MMKIMILNLQSNNLQRWSTPFVSYSYPVDGVIETIQDTYYRDETKNVTFDNILKFMEN